MNKRIASFCTAAVMIFTAIPAAGLETITAFAADYNYEYKTSYSYDFANDQISVVVDLTKNAGYNSGSFTMNWDGSAFELVNFDAEQAFCSNFDSDVEAPDGFYTFRYDNETNQNTSTGKVATFTFERLDYDAEVTYNFTITDAKFKVSGSNKTAHAENLTLPKHSMGDIMLSVGEAVSYNDTEKEIRVPINIDCNRGFIAGNATVQWNGNCLNFVGVEYNEELIPSLYPGDASSATNVSSSNANYKLSFGDLLATKNFTAKGTFATLIFKQKAVSSSEYNTPVSIVNADIVDYDLNEIDTAWNKGTVRVRESGVYFDEDTGVLTLRGDVVADDIKAYASNESVTKVVADTGTVLPADCSKLFRNFKAAEIDLSGASTSKATDMSYMFNNCQELIALNISGFDTSNVTTMRGMFEQCKKLTYVDVSRFNTANVTDMNSMFWNCKLLNNIDVTSFDTNKVTNMYGMFGYCEALSDIDLSGFSMTQVSDGTYMLLQTNALAHKICKLDSVIDGISRRSADHRLKRTINVKLGSDAVQLKIMNQYGEDIVSYDAEEIAAHKTNGVVSITYSAPFANTEMVALCAFDENGDLLINTDKYEKYSQFIQLRNGEKRPYSNMVYYVDNKIVVEDSDGIIFRTNSGESKKLSAGKYTLTSLMYRMKDDGTFFVIVQLNDINGNLTARLGMDILDGKVPVAIKVSMIHKIDNDNYMEVEPIYDNSFDEIEAKAATCEQDGNIKYYIGADSGLPYYIFAPYSTPEYKLYENDDYIIHALGHDWGEYTYEWSRDNTSCTRTRVCKRDSSHVETVTVNTIKEIGEDGIAYYKAFFTDDDYDVQIKKNDNYEVTVTNGKLSTGKLTGLAKVSQLVTVKANDAPSGKIFSHWERNGIKVSTNVSYSFYMPEENIRLNAVFADSAEETGTAIIESVTAANNKLSFVSVLNIPTSATFVKGGLVATNNSSIGEYVTAGNAAYVKLSTKATANTKNLKYTWTKSNVGSSTWYVRAYLVYKDSSGTEHTIYSDCVKANKNGKIG